MRVALKIGGSVLEPRPWPEMLDAVARLAAHHQVLVVHGGGKALNAELERLGLAGEFRRGLRVTDAPTLRAAVNVLAGQVNKSLVAALNTRPSAASRRRMAVGLTGIDATCVRARVQDPALGYVGAVDGADPALLESLFAAGFTPVLAPIAADGRGGALNVNADRFAAACALAVKADALVFVTDVAGVLDPDGRCLAQVSLAGLRALQASGAASGGMLPKLDACAEALAGGLARVEIVGPEAACRLDAWIGGACPGTRIVPDPRPAGIAVEAPEFAPAVETPR